MVENLAERYDWAFDRVAEDQIAMAIEGSWRTYSITLAWSAYDETLRMVCTFDMDPPADRLHPLYEALNSANEKTSLTVLIETAEGIENVDGIAALDGVDCLWIGHFDLSLSLGIPGEFDNPAFISAVEAVVTAAKKHNKSLGRLVGSVEEGAALYNGGFDFICYLGDMWLLQKALREGLNGIRDAVGGGA